MVNQQLIDYIRSEEAQGYNAAQLYQYLVQQGYNPNDVSEALHSVNQPQVSPQVQQNIDTSNKELHASSNKMTLIVTAATLGLIILGLLIGWFVTSPSCGDGTLDDDENPDNCCVDAGCVGDATCQDNTCIGPACGECQYVNDGVCVDHECCTIDDCPGTKECQSNKCVLMDCGECGYGVNHECQEYICCTDDDCDDSNPSTTDTCQGPSSLQSRCSHGSELELSEEEMEATINKGEKLEFDYEGQAHTIEIEQIAEYGATLIVKSEAQKLFFNIGDSKMIDITGDSLDDINLTLSSVVNESVVIKINKLKFACKMDMDCNDNNPKTTDKCIDPKTLSAVCENALILKDCGSDFSCFIEDSQKCTASKVSSLSYTTNTTSIITHTTASLEMRGFEGGDCIFYHVITDSSAELTESALENLENESFSETDAQQLERTASKTAARRIGTETTCKFAQFYVTMILNKWETGNFSADDMPDDECETKEPPEDTSIECVTDGDCDDSKSNTEDVCMNRGTVASYCEFTARGSDCEEKFNCFIAYAINCQPSHVLHTTQANKSGMTTTTTTHMEIRGIKLGQCIYFERAEAISVAFTEQTRTNLLAQGMSEDDIDAQEANTNQSTQGLVGIEFNCEFETDDMVDMLERWKQGNVQESDLQKASIFLR
ncbi:hypothetical protein ACFL96_18885 [Thermoproteota archaeon]